MIVVKPELLKGLSYIVQVLNPFDLVTVKREHFQVDELGHRHELLDIISGEAELLYELKLVNGLIKTVNRVR